MRRLPGAKGLGAEFFRSISFGAILRLTNLILTLISGVVLARVLGPSQYGTYAFVITLVTLLGVPVHAGLPNLIIREVSKNQIVGNWGLLRGSLSLSNLVVVTFSMMVASIVFLASGNTWVINDELKLPLFWGLMLLPLIGLSKIRSAALQGLRYTVLGQVPEQLVRPIVLILLLLGTVWVEPAITPAMAVKLTGVSVAVAFLVGAIMLMRTLPEQVKKAMPMYDFMIWRKSLLPLSLLAGVGFANQQINILLFGFLGNREDVALFRVASQGAALVVVALTVVSYVAAPYLSRFHNLNDKAKLQELVLICTRLSIGFALPIGLILIFWGRPFVTIIFGGEYQTASTALGLLCIGQLINAAVGPVGLVLNMTGCEKITLKVMLFSLLINCFLSILLIPHYGLLGGTISFLISLVAWNIMLSLQLYKTQGIKSFPIVRRAR